MGNDAEERFTLVPAMAAAEMASGLFMVLHDRLGAVLPHDAEIEHVGATAVPGCLTKGDLDVVVRVTPDAFAAAERTLSHLFERDLGSDRTDSFAAFKDDEAQPPLGVQLVVRGTPLDVFVRFRDRLRADPGLVAQYNAIKLRHNGRGMDTYRAAKSAFIETVLAQA